ncbi:hypothetical protein AB1N83_009778 [Pleurotus pulmonarius]
MWRRGDWFNVQVDPPPPAAFLNPSRSASARTGFLPIMSLTDSEEIDALLKYNPPPVEVPPTSVDESSQGSALSFYDMHLSSNLSLQRVVYLPSLLTDMITAVDTCLELADAEDADLPRINIEDCFRTKGQRVVRADRKSTDVVSIAKLYEATTASNCEAVASTVALSPQCPMWMPSITFRSTYNKDNPTDQAFILEEYSLSLFTLDNDIYFYPVVKECLEQEKIRLLRTLWKSDPRLATWEFLPYTTQAIAVIQNLCRGKPSHTMVTNTFYMQTYPSVGTFQEATAAVVPHDAEVSPWHFQDLRRNLRPRKAASTVHLVNYPSIELHVAPQPLSSKMSLADQVLQHAWVTACRRDSTFIVFQCGNYERIGIRHRASQTLYLSDVINVPSVTEPAAYTELHLNLYVSILHDAMQRAAHMPQARDDAPLLPRKRRRQTDGPPTRSQKCRKLRPRATHSFGAKTDVAARAGLSDNIFSRNIMLMFLQYSVYSSPNPTTFFRCGHQPSPRSRRARYNATEYMLIRLTSLITRGATGLVHEGTLEAYSDDLGLRSCRIVAKLAFGDEQKERMKHEAIIYEHLTKKGVRGIPKCYGIFEDTHGGPLVLVTSHEGHWLGHWVPSGSEGKLPVLTKKKFLIAMKEIHRANVCHRDIRPENMVMNENEDICIIDFDKADLTSSKGARKREYRHMERLLAGIYLPQGMFPSPRTASSGSGLSLSPISKESH